MYYVPLPIPKDFLRLFVEPLWGSDPPVRLQLQRKTHHRNLYVYTYGLCGIRTHDSNQ